MEKGDSYEEFVNWEKKKNSKWTKISKQIKPTHIIFISFLIFGGNYLVKTKESFSPFFWGGIIGFGILIVFLLYRETSEPRLIPEHIIKQIASNALDRKRLKGEEIPFDCKVRVMLPGEGIHEQDMVSRTSGTIRRDVGFEIIKKGYKKKGVIGIHPYSGIILGIRFELMGYTGKETKDRVIIPVGVLDQPK